ncbi:restriction endonuclease [Xanthobacter tagetidis]|uniref:Restriction endonuclease type IV Mrr domain-containing protein n=1 Tax=Xanthobacter tagetidis TaxID=60216 RepID=A0A3L7AFT3_9HYPH|nr:restriction endonuclease [Xanthobacter tagetidis]MBB6306001.1 hypothetical protein [Xanthobacter tagetidis]RLP78511.1 hypothetical protein D9R14_11980 [Xanthobacter tagetidis]
MPKPTPTRTINPVHFEDLEPRRFEDLVRQLAYEFRSWSRIEGTGRAGSDDGFDARAIETMQLAEAQHDDGGDEGSDLPAAENGRVWLIQCKREKSIPPKKMADYMDGLRSILASENVYGIVFAAACDFSKQARDVFFNKAREMGLGEAHLWGKAELEDMLFQPKNDGILFAYFGISLATRRRSIRADVRAMLATKRKASKLLKTYVPTLIRDATDDRYPWLDDDKKRHRFDRGRWRVMSYAGVAVDGLKFHHRRYFAWIGADGEEWDYAEQPNMAVPSPFEDPWNEETKEQGRERQGQEAAARGVWSGLPQDEQAWFETDVIIPWASVLDIDETGDEFFRGPIIYTTEFIPDRNGPFSSYRQALETKATFGARTAHPIEDNRTQKFSKVEPEANRDDEAEAAPPQRHQGGARIDVPDDEE